MSKTDTEYRNELDMPIELLAAAMWGYNSDFVHDDKDIVEIAGRKIEMLKKLLILSGFKEEMLSIMMEC